MALRAVHEDGDGEQIVANRELAARKDRPGRDRELVLTRLALEDGAALVAVDGEATTGRANRRAFSGGPTDLTEGVASLVVGHARDLR